MVVLKLITICSILLLGILLYPASSEDLNTSNIIIEFDPNGISILDIYQDRYSSDDLVPLVSLVATRFSKLFIRQNYNKFTTDIIVNSSLLGTAQYNCLGSTINKVQLFLVIKTEENCACDMIELMVTNITKLADQANNICNDTIHTILLESTSTKCKSHISDCSTMLNLSNRYIWGEIIPFEDYCDPKNSWNSTLEPFVVVVSFLDESSNGFNRNFSNCKPYVVEVTEEPTVMILDIMSDTVSKGSFKDIATFWESVSKSREYNFLLPTAFDTYGWQDEGNILNLYSAGWWRLAEDPGTTKTSEFVFEEKTKIALKVDKEENPLFLPWYRQAPFNKKTTGIIFKSTFSNDSTGKDFCRAVFLTKIENLMIIINGSEQMMAQCGKDFELIFLMKLLSKGNLNELLEIKKEQVTILLQYGFDETSLKFIQESGFKMGYYIDIDFCPLLIYDNLEVLKKTFTTNALSDPTSSIYIFYYEEYQDTVDFGATRMFRLRTTLFNSCKKLVLNSRNTSAEIGFALTAYYKRSNFYDSSGSMKNYVKYIDSVSDWAENTSNTVIFISKDDEQSYKGDYDRSWDTVGWYSYNSFVEKNGYKPKDGKLLNDLIMLSDTSSLVPNNQQLVLVLGSIFIFFLIAVLVYFVRKYKKNYQLSKEESEHFFKGRLSEPTTSDQVDPSDIAYDMQKYEIEEDDFKVDLSKMLGSGEFGIVCGGTVIIDDEEVQVAVKSTNPKKLHKTMLNGLLSEIKVLSFVGQHPNIIKLLGACTSKMRSGQVYVFLELCQLGSLQNCLRKLHSLEPIIITSGTISEFGLEMSYANTISSNRGLLDASLSNDLYRWSKEICSGMAYLAGKHILHADLATRNILLNLRQEAKICDFGLSRRMYNYASYVKTQQEPLPWKWMAPESLRFMRFNEKTDVWSFDVTLWEMYSLGSIPYAGLSWDVNFIQMLEGGLLPSKPDFDERNMYKLMKDCWNIIADQRPSFSRILSILEALPADIVDDTSML